MSNSVQLYSRSKYLVAMYLLFCIVLTWNPQEAHGDSDQQMQNDAVVKDVEWLQPFARALAPYTHAWVEPILKRIVAKKSQASPLETKVTSHLIYKELLPYLHPFLEGRGESEHGMTTVGGLQADQALSSDIDRLIETTTASRQQKAECSLLDA